MSDVNELKEQIALEISKVKKTLYKEEAKSAIFAAAFAGSMASVFMTPFTFGSFLCLLFGFYMLGFFKPTIRKQMQLHEVIKGLMDMLQKVENPPKQQKSNTPWKT